MFTIVFLSFHSETHIKRLVSVIEKKYPIIVIENSLNIELKNELEKKYDNVKVIIPQKNMGISAGYNLGIKESKTNYVKLTSPDINLSNESLKDLEECVSKIKDFAILAPTYDDESIYKNYAVFNSKNLATTFVNEIFKKFSIKEVDFIENDFIISKKDFANLGFFDENMFLYYETADLCKKARVANKKIYACQKIKFTHYGSQSTDSKFSYQLSLTRSWHYNWSKFYYYKKNFGFFFGLKKISPNFVRAIKNMIISIISKKNKEYFLHKTELSGILASIFNKPSNYRSFDIK